jgi:hypothetical protein
MNESVFRTAEERFEDLPGYGFEPHYVEVDGLRLHHVDEGSRPVVVCFTASPRGATYTGTWSAVSWRVAGGWCAPTSSASAAPTSPPIRAGTRTTASRAGQGAPLAARSPRRDGGRAGWGGPIGLRDPIFPYPVAGELFTQLIPGAGEQVRIRDAAHFVQEDAAPQLLEAMAAAMAPASARRAGQADSGRGES